jgi:hypothetical protein
LPGGSSHSSYSLVEEEAAKAGFKLVAGKGNDPDTLGKQTVYVYDTKEVREESLAIAHCPLLFVDLQTWLVVRRLY